MYQTLILFHGWCRWLVLLSLVYTTITSIKGYRARSSYSSRDNLARHGTATVMHVQLTLGMLLYFASPFVSSYWNSNDMSTLPETEFFAVIHSTMMFIAVILATYGSSAAKRKTQDSDKFKTVAFFYSLALLIILLAIPWSFAPWAQRPLLRTF